MIGTLICTGILLVLMVAYILTGRGLLTPISSTRFFLWTTLWFIIQGGVGVAIWQADLGPVTTRFADSCVIVWFIIHLVSVCAIAYTRYPD